MKNLLKYLIGKMYALVCRKEYHAQQFKWVNERPIEFAFVFNCLKSLNVRDVLDVGTGTTALPHLIRNCGYMVTAIDNIRDYWPKGMYNRHYYVIDDDITSTRLKSKFDLITCISVLEHIRDSDKAVHNMFELLNDNGHLILTFPYNEHEYVENVYAHEEASYGKENPFICQVYSRKEINAWLSAHNAEIVTQEYWRVFTGKFWTFGEQVYPREQTTQHQPHHLTCLLLRKRPLKPVL